MKTEACPQGFANLRNSRRHFQDLVKHYKLSEACGNQTSLVSSTAAVEKDPSETVIDTGNGAIENAEVSFRHSATHGSRKQNGIAN